ncbi:uncharacterized protein LOC111106702 [Crassostrea virginica]
MADIDCGGCDCSGCECSGCECSDCNCDCNGCEGCGDGCCEGCCDGCCAGCEDCSCLGLHGCLGDGCSCHCCDCHDCCGDDNFDGGHHFASHWWLCFLGDSCDGCCNQRRRQGPPEVYVVNSAPGVTVPSVVTAQPPSYEEACVSAVTSQPQKEMPV